MLSGLESLNNLKVAHQTVPYRYHGTLSVQLPGGLLSMRDSSRHTARAVPGASGLPCLSVENPQELTQ